MGRAAREIPTRLAEKLKQVRERLRLSQGGMLIRLGYDDSQITRVNISKYEAGKSEPPVLVLYAYARAANVYIEVLVDDDVDLPALIPSNEKSSGRKKRTES